MRLVDTHCHIDLDAFSDDRQAVVDRAHLAGVSHFLLIGFEPERWRATSELREQIPGISLAAGLHPNSASQYSDELLAQIAAQAARPEVIAIGETGIDLYWDDAPLELQQRAFADQIDLARQLDMPFVIHQRDAELEVLDVLKQFSTPLNGVLHCFTGNWHYAQEILNLGLHIGLGGAITFKSRTDLHDAATRMPLDRIVLETDSPFMAPVPHRGKRNEPSYVAIMADRLAELRNLDVEVIAETTTTNASALFPGVLDQGEVNA
jgi:TatD DNase family protein